MGVVATKHGALSFSSVVEREEFILKMRNGRVHFTPNDIERIANETTRQVADKQLFKNAEMHDYPAEAEWKVVDASVSRADVDGMDNTVHDGYSKKQAHSIFSSAFKKVRS